MNSKPNILFKRRKVMGLEVFWEISFGNRYFFFSAHKCAHLHKICLLLNLLFYKIECILYTHINVCRSEQYKHPQNQFPNSDLRRQLSVAILQNSRKIWSLFVFLVWYVLISKSICTNLQTYSHFQFKESIQHKKTFFLIKYQN